MDRKAIGLRRDGEGVGAGSAGYTDAVEAHSYGSRGLGDQSRDRARSMADMLREAASGGSALGESLVEGIAPLAEDGSVYYAYALEHPELVGDRGVNAPTLSSVARFLGLTPPEVRELKQIVQRARQRNRSAAGSGVGEGGESHGV